MNLQNAQQRILNRETIKIKTSGSFVIINPLKNILKEFDTLNDLEIVLKEWENENKK